MPIVNKGPLKGYFKPGDIPNESNYINLIDSCFPIQGEGIRIAESGNERIIALHVPFIDEMIGKKVNDNIGDKIDDKINNSTITVNQTQRQRQNNVNEDTTLSTSFTLNQRDNQNIDILRPSGTINITDGVRNINIDKVDNNNDRIELSTLSFTGSWNDIRDVPDEIKNPSPITQIQADWRETDNKSPAYIRRKPGITDGKLYITQNNISISPTNEKDEEIDHFTPMTDISTFYNISAPDWNAHESAESGIKNKPILSRVAITGEYRDLLDSPDPPHNSIIKIFRNEVQNHDELVGVGSGGGSGALATATLRVRVINVAIVDGGSGYLSVPLPTVTIQNPPTGVAAIAQAFVHNGTITSITIENIDGEDGNWGYSLDSRPIIAISPPPTGGRQAIAVAITDACLKEIDVTESGSGYTGVPGVTILGGYGASAFAIIESVTRVSIMGEGTGATATIRIDNGVVTNITVVRGGVRYMPDTTHVVITGEGTGAVATANIDSGVIVSITIVDGGSGYKNGGVVDIRITNHGYGFSENVEVIVGGAPVVFSLNQPEDGKYDLGLGLAALTNRYSDLDEKPIVGNFDLEIRLNKQVLASSGEGSPENVYLSPSSVIPFAININAATSIVLHGDVLSNGIIGVDENGHFDILNELRNLETRQTSDVANYELLDKPPTIIFNAISKIVTDGKGRTIEVETTEYTIDFAFETLKTTADDKNYNLNDNTKITIRTVDKVIEDGVGRIKQVEIIDHVIDFAFSTDRTYIQTEGYVYSDNNPIITLTFVDKVIDDRVGRVQEVNTTTKTIDLSRLQKITEHDNRLTTLEAIGGRWIGFNFETYEEFSQYNKPSDLRINEGDYTYVIRDETKKDPLGFPQLTLYRWSSMDEEGKPMVESRFVFSHVVQEDPIGAFINGAFGVIKGDDKRPGYVSAQGDGTGKVNLLPTVLDYDCETKKIWLKGDIPEGYAIYGFSKGVFDGPMEIELELNSCNDCNICEYNETETNLLCDSRWNTYVICPIGSVITMSSYVFSVNGVEDDFVLTFTSVEHDPSNNLDTIFSIVSTVLDNSQPWNPIVPDNDWVTIESTTNNEFRISLTINTLLGVSRSVPITFIQEKSGKAITVSILQLSGEIEGIDVCPMQTTGAFDTTQRYVDMGSPGSANIRVDPSGIPDEFIIYEGLHDVIAGVEGGAGLKSDWDNGSVVMFHPMNGSTAGGPYWTHINSRYITVVVMGGGINTWWDVVVPCPADPDVVPSDPVKCDNHIATGSTSNGLTWTLCGNTLWVEGSGSIPNYSSGGSPWNAHRGSITTVVLSGGIAGIGDNAFSGSGIINDLFIYNNNVILISNTAFSGHPRGRITIRCHKSLINSYYLALKGTSQRPDVAFTDWFNSPYRIIATFRT